LSITGIIHPDRIIRKGGAREGDRLILTKPIGTGILTTVLKAAMLPEAIETRMTAQLTALNDKASRVMLAVGARACTDVTGFGLLGHLAEMAEASRLSARLDCKAIPMIPESLQYAHMGLIPEGMYANWEYRQPMVDAGGIDEDTMAVLYDPQTSGGLLIAIAPEKSDTMIAELKAAGITQAAVIGEMVEGTPSRIKVV
jgi:selenide,water dikinase